MASAAGTPDEDGSDSHRNVFKFPFDPSANPRTFYAWKLMFIIRAVK